MEVIFILIVVTLVFAVTIGIVLMNREDIPEIVIEEKQEELKERQEEIIKKEEDISLEDDDLEIL